MTIEAATYISQLNPLYPAAGDPKSEGDDHLRLLKSVLQAAYAKTASGATQIPGGLILQWAYGSSVLPADSTSQVITLPVTFPTANLFSMVALRGDSHTSGAYSAVVTAKTLSAVTCYFIGSGSGADLATPMALAIGY